MFNKLDKFNLEDATQIAYYLITILTKEDAGVYIEYVPHDLDQEKLKIAEELLDNMNLDNIENSSKELDKLIISVSNYINDRHRLEKNVDLEKGKKLLEKMNKR